MSSYDEEIDQFHFDSLDQVEDMRRYRPGGYHPIKLGDMLASSTSRYRILHKLGHGSFATVWLARDIRPEGYVYEAGLSKPYSQLFIKSLCCHQNPRGRAHRSYPRSGNTLVTLST